MGICADVRRIAEKLPHTDRADYGTRTRNPRITSTVRYQLRQVGGRHQLTDGIIPTTNYGVGVAVGLADGVGVSFDCCEASLSTVSTNCENSCGSSSAPT